MIPQERAANYMRLKDGYKNKEEQKQHLIDMMQDDEKLGLYDKPKQTAVEWLFFEMKGTKWINADWEKRRLIIEQAKEMEKHQIIEAFWNGDNTDCLSEQNAKEFAEQYYSQTYDKSR